LDGWVDSSLTFHQGSGEKRTQDKKEFNGAHFHKF